MLLLASFASGVQLVCGESISEKMEGFRKEIPLYNNIDYGQRYIDRESGDRWGIPRLARTGRELIVLNLKDVLALVSYLRDRDPKIQYIAATKIVRVLDSDINIIELVDPDRSNHPECINQLINELSIAIESGKLDFDVPDSKNIIEDNGAD